MMTFPIQYIDEDGWHDVDADEHLQKAAAYLKGEGQQERQRAIGPCTDVYEFCPFEVCRCRQAEI